MAHKMLFTRLAPLFLLSSGLISCSSDKSDTLDNFAPEKPRLINTLHPEEIQPTSATLTADFAIELGSSAQGLSTQITSKCRKANYLDIYEKTKGFSGRKTVHLIEALPNKVVLDPESYTDLLCEFSIKFKNQNSSTHEFILSERPLDPKQTLQMQPALTQGISATPVKSKVLIQANTITNFSLAKKYLRSANQLICKDFSLTLPQQNEFSNLGFIYSHAQRFNPALKARLLDHPLQECQIASVDKSENLALSPQFTLLFPQIGADIINLGIEPLVFLPEGGITFTLAKFEILNITEQTNYYSIDLGDGIIPISGRDPYGRHPERVSSGATTLTTDFTPQMASETPWLQSVEPQSNFVVKIQAHDVFTTAFNLEPRVRVKQISYQFNKPIYLVRHIMLKDGQLVEAAREELSMPWEVLAHATDFNTNR